MFIQRSSLSTASGDHRRATNRSEEHTSLQSRLHLVCRLLLEKKKIRRLPRDRRRERSAARVVVHWAFFARAAATHRLYLAAVEVILPQRDRTVPSRLSDADEVS